MALPRTHVRLKKELRLVDVYAIATGATLSAGFFLLPGIAAISAGPGLVLAYMLAACGAALTLGRKGREAVLLLGAVVFTAASH